MGLFDKLNPFGNDDKDDVVNEDTPLSHSASENSKAAPGYLKNQAIKLYNMSREGPLSFRVLAFLGGLAMIGSSTYDIVMSLLPGNATSLLLAIYTLLFGIGICILEGKTFSVPESWIRTLHFYFRILDYTWGRGACYAFAGSLILTQPFNLLHSIVGGYMIFVGCVAFISSIGAGHKLFQLRMAIDTQRDLKAFFKQYDKSGEDSLTESEFAAMLAGLGVEVTYQELVACFNAIDKNDDERVTYDEFLGWWKEWGGKQLHRGFSDLIV